MSEPEEGEIDLRARGPDGVPVDPIGTPALSDNGRTVTPTVSVGVATLSCVDNHERLQKRKRNDDDDHAADDDEQTGQKLTSKHAHYFMLMSCGNFMLFSLSWPD